MAVELKFMRDAEESAFIRSVGNYGYHFQAAWQLDLLNAVSEGKRRHVHIVCEKSPPYCAAVYTLDEDAIECGRRARIAYLKAWSKAIETDNWRGYDPAVVPITLPPWLLKGLDYA